MFSTLLQATFDKRKHFDYNIGRVTSIVISCLVSSSCNNRSHHPEVFSAFSQAVWQSSIEHGGTSAIYIFMATLAL